MIDKWPISYCHLKNMKLSSCKVKKYKLGLGRHRKKLFYLLTLSCVFVQKLLSCFKLTLLIHLLIIWVIQLFLYRSNLYKVLQGRFEVNVDFRVRIAFHSALGWNQIVPGLKVKAPADPLFYICTPGCMIQFHKLLLCAWLHLCTFPTSKSRTQALFQS